LNKGEKKQRVKETGCQNKVILLYRKAYPTECDGPFSWLASTIVKELAASVLQVNQTIASAARSFEEGYEKNKSFLLRVIGQVINFSSEDKTTHI
jgi:hypothetical protein